jgi:hypothetical protein
MSSRKIFLSIFIVGAVLYGAAFAYRAHRTRMDIWLPEYLKWSARSSPVQDQPIHIFFFFTDHFEPAGRVDIFDRWMREYPKLAVRHRDHDGRPVQHTWFYPVEQKNDAYLTGLQKLVVSGYGEVELHLHHGSDNWASALRKFRDGIAYLQQFGFQKTTDGETRFAFVHGNNSLDNSLGPRFCGVTRELTMLRELGCFADFTFPTAWDSSQPAMVNEIFEAVDTDGPKSYKTGLALAEGKPAVGDLLIFTGPLVIRPTLNPAKLFFTIDNSDIHPTFQASPTRVDSWVRANIHVGGRPDWIFIKVSSHGASSTAFADSVLGPNFDGALSYLESHYNDGSRYVLHYITAREAYNLARAAVDGQHGDPAMYLDWAVKPYKADGRAPAVNAVLAQHPQLQRPDLRKPPSP